MHDQADHLRQLVRNTINQHPVLEPGVPLVALSGGTQGVGTSTIAVHLAKELTNLGHQAMVVDAHPQQQETASRLGSSVRGGLADVLRGSRSAVEVLESVEEQLTLLPGNWHHDRLPPLDRKAVDQCLAELRAMGSHADFVLIDLGSGMTPWVQRFWQTAQQVLLVTTDQPEAIKASYAAIKLAPWSDVNGKVRLVVNQAEDLVRAEQVATRIGATCREFLGIQIKSTAAIRKSESGTQLISPSPSDTAYWQSLRLLAADVVANSLAVSKPVTNVRRTRTSPDQEVTKNTKKHR